MEYFQLGISTNDEVPEVYTPVDEDGQCVESGKGESLVVAGTSVLLGRPPKELPDCLDCVGGELIVSMRAAEIFSRAQMESGVRFVPTKVNTSRGEFVGDYVTITFPTFQRILDKSRTAFRYEEGISVPLEAVAPVIASSLTKDYDIVCSVYLGNVVSKKLKMMIESAHLRGFAFTPVAVSRD